MVLIKCNGKIVETLESAETYSLKYTTDFLIVISYNDGNSKEALKIPLSNITRVENNYKIYVKEW